jgi:NAD-dependent deacetylase
VGSAVPNAAHTAIAAIERANPAFTLATQNVDDLHERAGSRNVLHLHGEIVKSRCLEDCGMETAEDPGHAVPLCSCGAPLRPAVVWFGEMLPEGVLETAFNEAGRCDVCLVVGTSAVVYPAAGIPAAARHSGAFVVEMNPEETPLSSMCDITIRGPAAQVLPAFLAAIRGAAPSAPARSATAPSSPAPAAPAPAAPAWRARRNRPWAEGCDG